MSTPETSALVTLLGSLHFVQLPAMWVLIRGPLALGSELARVAPVTRRVLLLFVIGLIYLLLALGLLLVFSAAHVATSELGRGLSAVLAVFFGLRAAAQIWLYRVWPGGARNRALYFVFGSLYLLLALGYSQVAIRS